MTFHYDKENNLVTISNSILKHFTNKTFNCSNPTLDSILAQKPYKKIVVILFDGLGKSIREKHLSKNDFLRKKEKIEITSIFPPTTVAATTSFITGQYPNQTGWLGWQQLFKQNNLVIEMFTNVNSKTRERIPNPLFSSLYCPYTSIIERINQDSNTLASTLNPDSIDKNGAKNLDDFFLRLDQMMKNDKSHFIYAYWNEPDHLIHLNGTDDYQVKDIVKKINRKVQKISKENKDNLIIVLADHSLVNTSFFYIYEHEDFKNTLSNIISLDSRSCFFHVFPDKKEEFQLLFNKYYKDYFILKTKEEVINEKWFGEGENHPLFEDFIGDFMATSISKYGFTFHQDEALIGAHAGSLEEESKIMVSIINQ